MNQIDLLKHQANRTIRHLERKCIKEVCWCYDLMILYDNAE